MFGTIFFAVIIDNSERFCVMVANYKDLTLIDQNGNREDICEFLFCDFVENPTEQIRKIQGYEDTDVVRIIAHVE